jgi:hypothetical protein
VRLRPEPKPKSERLTGPALITAIDTWLDDIYSIPANQRGAASNLNYATLRVLRGSETSRGTSAILTDVDATTAARRLRRAAALFVDLADRLED